MRTRRKKITCKLTVNDDYSAVWERESKTLAEEISLPCKSFQSFVSGASLIGHFDFNMKGKKCFCYRNNIKINLKRSKGGMASFVGNSCWALQHRLNYTHLIKTYKIYSITVRNSNNIIYTFFSLSEIFFSLFFFSFSSRFSSIEFGRIANDTNRDRDWVKEHIF